MNEITYTVTITDMKAFLRHHRRVSPAMRRVRFVTLILFSGISLDTTIRTKGPSIAFHITYFFVMLTACLIIVFVLFSIMNWVVQWSAFRAGDRHGVLGQHTITLTPEALYERTAVNESKALWRSLYRIDGSPQHIFIFTQPNGAHVIPRRAFPTSADADAFLETAKKYYDAAQ
jgi:hypothetical protein